MEVAMNSRALFPALLLSLAALAVGCGPRGFHGRGAWRHADPARRAEAMTEHLAKTLDLTADQQAKTLPLLRALADERQAWRGEAPALLGELKAQFASGAFDAKALDAALKQREAKLARSRALLVQKLAEFHAILNPEQRAKAAEALGRLQARLEAYNRPKE
jgi:Spy/CpxP family protein refolding chaperone